MNFKKSIINFLLIFGSFLTGISLIEFLGRSIGLGNPILYEPDSLVGYRLRPNQSKKRRINSFVNSDYEGFRFDPNAEFSDNSEYIVFVGDSVTYGGSYINDSDLFASNYCKLKFNIDFCLNNGINSWGTMNMGRFIANYDLYSNREPKKIILVILPGDERRNFRSFTDTPFWSTKPKNPRAINEVLRYLLIKKISPIFETNEKFLKNNSFNKDKEKIIFAQRKQAWKELDLLLNKSKIPINVVLTPPRNWFIDKNSSNEIKIYGNLLASLNSQKITKKCNIYEFLKNKYSYDLYVDGVHLSKKGHELWGKTLRECLD